MSSSKFTWISKKAFKKKFDGIGPMRACIKYMYLYTNQSERKITTYYIKYESQKVMPFCVIGDCWTKNAIRWLSLVLSKKKEHTIWIIFHDDNLCGATESSNIRMCVCCFDKFPNGNEMRLITLIFHLIDETITFLACHCFFSRSVVKIFGLFVKMIIIIWELHFSGTN